MEFKCGSWKIMFIKKYKINTFFHVENSKNIPKVKMISKKMGKFRSWKTWSNHGKGHGKSWNFKSSKEYKP